VLYVDERGQGRSDRVDPVSLSLDVFARDVDLLAEALGLERFALLGHSFGAIITTWHAINLRTADAYVISGGADSNEKLMADVAASLESMGESGVPIAQSWEDEKTVRTEEELQLLIRVQMPFHFAGEPPVGKTRSGALTYCGISPALATAISTSHRSSAVSTSRRLWSSARRTGRPQRGLRTCSTKAFTGARSSSSRAWGM
jgi:pimeloyl-ACP methyl ester carboxylesterase